MYGRQQRDEKERELETGGNKAPIGEIRMIFGGLVVGGSSKSLKKTCKRGEQRTLVVPTFKNA